MQTQAYLSRSGTHVVRETVHTDHREQHHTPLADWPTGEPYAQERAATDQDHRWSA